MRCRQSLSKVREGEFRLCSANRRPEPSNRRARATRAPAAGTTLREVFCNSGNGLQATVETSEPQPVDEHSGSSVTLLPLKSPAMTFSCSATAIAFPALLGRLDDSQKENANDQSEPAVDPEPEVSRPAAAGRWSKAGSAAAGSRAARYLQPGPARPTRSGPTLRPLTPGGSCESGKSRRKAGFFSA